MNKRQALTISGALLGLFAGSSMGIAVGGDAYNAAWFLAPIGAAFGWLAAPKIAENTNSKDAFSDEQSSPESLEERHQDSEKSQIGKIFEGALRFLAILWNLHIALIEYLGLLPAFQKQPLLFLGLCVVTSLLFPPFFAVYFLAWLSSVHFGMSKKSGFRADVE